MSSRETVVVIDDEEVSRDVLSRIVTGEGYNCKTFGNAREALDSMDKLTPIVIFLDICMPDMNGLQFLHELRKSHTSVPVIVISGYADQDMFRQTLRYRIADFLAKPFAPSIAQDSMRKALGRDDTITDQFLETITYRLRDARINLGLKQSEVAARCGVSTSQISQIELRQSCPSVTTLLRLCKALNLTMEELVQGF